jgi:single-stranded-DNA-specific exonuclease
MKYQLIENKKEFSNFTEQVLYNRGIEDPQKYLNLDNSAILDYHLLNNIELAAETLLNHIENNVNMVLIVDEDNDGITSSAMLYSYLHKIYPDIKLNYLLHTRKSHGLSKDISIPENTQLVILLDAGTNDSDEAKILKEKGIDVICIDHHTQEEPNPYAIIVNNQCSELYTNKSLSGAGMCYQFIRCLDDCIWENRADDYLDLAALGIIGDSMDIRSYENKRIIDLGLSNIHNKAFQAFLDKQTYSTGGKVNIINIQFYIVPLINSIIRSGTQEEKETLFRAFIETDEVFDYKKRGETEIIKEDIYSRIARLATNSKARQNREVEKGLEAIKKEIYAHNWQNNKILFANATGMDSNFTGLLAIKLANEFSKPCVLVKDNTWKPGYFGGSIRNYDNSPIENLKDFLLSTKMFEFIQGHPSAAGISLEQSKIRDVIKLTNEMLKDVDFDKTYKIDFILEPEELTYELIQQIDQLKDYYGQNISEPLVLIKGLKTNTNDIRVMGDKKDTWKILTNSDEGITIIKFKCPEDDKLLNTVNESWGEDIVINVIGRVGISNFQNILSPQMTVVDYELVT